MIDKNSPTAMYEQIVNILREEILKKKYGDGGSIGTQEELARRFEVSLITVRKALMELGKENLITIRQGRGTYVKAAAISDSLTKLTGISNLLEEHQLKPTVVVQSMKAIDTPEYFQAEIRQQLGRKCYYITRVHMIDDTVCGYARLYLPIKYGQALSCEEVEKNTLYQLYQDKFHLTLGKGVQRMYADRATKPLAIGMKIPVGTPILYLTRSSYSTEGELIEYAELFFEHTQYRFEVELDISAI